MQRTHRGMAIALLAVGGLALLAAPAGAGTIFAIPDNLVSGSIDLFLTSGSNTTGSVVSTDGTFNVPFIIPANGTAIVTIPDSRRLVTSGVISSSAAFRITGDNPFAAYMMDVNIPVASNDITNLFPEETLGTSYRVMTGFSNIVGGSGPQVTVMANEDNTVITVTPTANLNSGQAANVPFNVVLNKGQAVMYESGNGTDLTGTLVSATKAIAVFGGHDCANVPANTTYCDHLIEQMFPTSTFGRNFAIVPTDRTGFPGDFVRILADQNGTVVTVDDGIGGVQVINLNAGQWYDFTSGNYVNTLTSVSSNNPILVGQYMVGSSAGSTTLGDPAFSLVPDVGQWLDEYIFNVPTGYVQNYVNLAIEQADAASLLLDGGAIAGLSPIPGTTLVGGLLRVSEGSHRILADAPFMLLSHGFDANYASYFGIGGSRTSGGGFEPPPPDGVIPEPSTLVLLGAGLLGALGVARRRRRAA